MTGPPPNKKRVIVVGAGASGMSACHALSLCPDKFDVTLYDKQCSLGGSATSYQLPDPAKYGSQYINDGVQGASPVFHNTFKVFESVLGFKAQEVGLQISFGKGKDTFWSNVFPSELVDRFSDDIKKFGKTLRTIKRFEVFFAVIPVHRMLRLFGFSDDFGERMVYPLVALFFGTGNDTKHISSAILERVFLDPSMRLFEYSEDSLLASVPTMMAFPELARVYAAWRDEVSKNGNIRVETSREVTEIQRGTREARKAGGNILVTSRKVDKDGKPLATGDEEARTEVYDDLILACDADTILKVLGKGTSWRERKVLGSVTYKWDITSTHNDVEYMERHYQMTYDAKYNADRHDDKSKESFAFAEKNWKPLYLIKMYDDDPALIEMSFDLTNYQPQFGGVPATGPNEGGARSESSAPPTERQGPQGRQGDSQEASLSKPAPRSEGSSEQPPLSDHVFQTIFLNRDLSDKWTKDEIRADKVILEKWWKQQSHRWTHYAYVVPWLWAINGKNHTQFCGGWTLVNMHEVAIVSGYAAAYALGAPYPFQDDKECSRLFYLYNALSHLGFSNIKKALTG
ncbi:uncharacterized protein PFL1_05408 [Pseudozyma flocculosa PF-1]|uniref:Related to flavin-containing amine oxidasedehydrogenase n=2 Tax=Pseudozyma flocculosa TaxID=84751 RepID=A0A5C3FA14_9BASI|nr:uncharacterized protein PFL1_05408 [Pseudozyma flocculosa PF-1]EPQ27127.1 hypothetical protein PFL1_05408 [Pseudozyma flocculosa PF-1]SPO41298.1 related to flavin-containing amine oxidasedehydrogenase [Pseudozyma flocculosa]